MALLEAIQNVISVIKTLATPTKMNLTVTCRQYDSITDFVLTGHMLVAKYELPEGHTCVSYVAGQSETVGAYIYNPGHDLNVSPYSLVVQDHNTTLSVDVDALRTMLGCIPDNKVQRRLLYPGQSTTLQVRLKVVRALRNLMLADIERTAKDPPKSPTAAVT